MPLRLPALKSPKRLLPPFALYSSISKPQLSQDLSSQAPISPSPPKCGLTSDTDSEIINPTKLRHLLRLSALLPPSSEVEEQRMLATLRTQLQFVRDLQGVDTEGVEPLVCLRDETEEGIRELTYTAENMREHIEAHKKQGRRGWVKTAGAGEERKKDSDEEWDVLGQAPRRQGRFFLVEREEAPKD
ncbi:MAG: hypothetical protein M1814_005411 [Vezdaea aestivalis]|nr:MAG: hypothetical protein M1814_005411 [Vezdaea aestivalis]